jgi:hypothetical protein
VGQLIDLFFKPPPMPPIELPLPARLVPGRRATIARAFDLAYHRGVCDGFVAGVLVTLLFLPLIRSRVTNGIAHALDHPLLGGGPPSWPSSSCPSSAAAFGTTGPSPTRLRSAARPASASRSTCPPTSTWETSAPRPRARHRKRCQPEKVSGTVVDILGPSPPN